LIVFYSSKKANLLRCSPATIRLIEYWSQTNGKRKAADIFGGKPGGCDEIMVISQAFDHNARLRSYEILTEIIQSDRL